MFRLGILIVGAAALACAQGFTFNIASPVAARDGLSKMAAFVFRTEGCSDPKPVVSGTAEGLVKGERRSVPLKVDAMSKPGVYAVNQTWPVDGTWVVALRGTCGAANAGAVIPIGPRGFVRESSKFYPRPATAEEVEAALKATAGGRQ